MPTLKQVHRLFRPRPNSVTAGINSSNANTTPYIRISLVYFTYFSVVGALTPYWSLYLEYLQYSPAAIGAIVAIPMVTKIIAPNMWGWLADRSGRRLLVTRLGATGSCLCFVGLLLAQSGWWFLVCIAAFSFFWNAIHAQFEVVTLGYLKHRPESYSHVRLWGSVGFIVIVIALGFLFDKVSVAYLPGIILVFLAGIFFSTLCLPAQHQVKSTQVLNGFLRTLLHPRILSFFAVLFLIQLSLGVYHAFFSIYMKDLGYSKTAIGLLWALSATAEILLFVLAPKYLKRYRLRSLILVTLGITLVRWVLMVWLAHNSAIVAIAQCMHAFTFGMTHVVAIEFVRREFSGEIQGQGQAFYNAVGFGAANALGSVIGGFIYEFDGRLTFIFSIGVILVAFLVHYFAREKVSE